MSKVKSDIMQYHCISRPRGKIVGGMVGVDNHKIKCFKAAAAEARIQRNVGRFVQAHHSAERRSRYWNS